MNPSSFRDPNGFIFQNNGEIFRQVNTAGREEYDLLLNSGLYADLIHRGWLIPHVEKRTQELVDGNCYRIIKPELIPFISYPYEWCFSQLKDAAILTLKIQQLALSYGMVLRDASAFNVQFHRGKPILIDTLSFGKYQEGEPWTAYRQYCQHFFAPLMLMSKVDIRLGSLSKIYIDGIPLDLTSKLLPISTWFNNSSLFHLHLHASAQRSFAQSSPNFKRGFGLPKLSKNGLLGIVSGMKNATQKLEWRPVGTEWGDYYKKTNYSSESFNSKSNIINELLDRINPKTLWDFGGNIGLFSRLASSRGIKTLSIDIDPAAIEINYDEVKQKQDLNILPLIVDLTNPSPSIGWANKERLSLLERGPVDCILALALIHHLAISNNVPLLNLADTLSKVCSDLIIEFIPKSDSQVQRLLASRVDIFPNYSEFDFESSFLKTFTIEKKVPIEKSSRTLYWFKNRSQIRDKNYA